MTLAFACGYLTHIAADQVVHPFVNSIAGPYYASHKNRRTHREVEVYQDVALYATVEGGDLMEARPNAWCDLKQGSGQETEDWFRSTICARRSTRSTGTPPTMTTLNAGSIIFLTSWDGRCC